MEKKRSVGVTIFATIFMLAAILNAYSMLIKEQPWKDKGLLFTLIQSTLILVIFLTSFSLYSLKKWGRNLALFFGTTIYLLPLIAIITNKLTAKLKIHNLSFIEWTKLILVTIWAIIPVFLLWWFFTRPKIKEQFK